MTGIERLRTLAGEWDAYGLGGALAEIADEIERERAEDCYRMGLDCGTVLRVVADMERHCLGHEGMEDSPVARWARELRGALKSDASDGRDTQNTSCADPDGAADVTSEAQKVTRDPAEDVSVSAYDLLPADERDAIAWVREHGGLDYVRAEWRSRVPYDRYEARRQRLLDHIAECETALGRRNERIEKMGKTIEFYQLNNSNFRHLLADVAERLGFTRFGNDYEPCDLIDSLDRRLMPEGCEWPRYESGEPVRIGDDYECWCGETHEVCSVTIREGSSALNESHPHTFVVSDGPFTAHGKRVKRPSVLAADGEPLEAGQTVYNVGSSEERVVDHIEYEGGGTPNVYYADGGWDYPDLITHQRPVLDANGVLIKKGDTVYFTDGREQECNTVVNAKYDYKDEPYVQLGRLNEAGYPTYTNCSCIDPSQLTHTKPEPPDSWKRIEEDKGLNPFDYCKDVGHRLDTCENAEAYKARDLVLRAKKLAGVDND